MPTASELHAAACRHLGAGQPTRAEPLLRQALALDPKHAPSLYQLGVLAHDGGRASEALGWFRAASTARPGDPVLLSCIGAAHQALGQFTEAARYHREALRHDADNVVALNNLGISLAALGQNQEAEQCLRRVLDRQPDAGAWCNLGAVLHGLNRPNEAADCYRRALALQPGLAQPHLNLGNLEAQASRLDEAEHHYREALRLWQGAGPPWAALGKTLLAQGRLAEGKAYLLAALEAEPTNAAAHGSYLGALLYDPGSEPGFLYAEHRGWAEQHFPAPPPVPAEQARPREPGGRLRVGYVSADFRRHAVAWFVEPILRHHDRSRVEVFCYAGVETPDDLTARLRGLAEHWRDTLGLSDENVAELVKSDGIDVLVDLAGHTTGGRPGLFALRPAPVQVGYLGYPFTTGLPAIRYRLGDAVTDPEGEAAAPWEEVVRLPGCFCCYAPPEDAPPVEGPPEADGTLTFCSMHKLEKLNDAVLDVWAELLKAVPGSRLLLCRDTLQGRTAERLVQRFVKRGVGPERVRLERVSADGWGHLRAYGRADVALDVWPWSGHTTACEALWMGVPVVTLLGKHHAGRMTASVLTCLGLQDLVAQTPEEYVQVAAVLAADGERRKELRAGLRRRMLASRLCDGKGFTRVLERTYENLSWESKSEGQDR
jgi:predicted O-linked N-acetylglucosamine transferase (SPINDLY family)